MQILKYKKPLILFTIYVSLVVLLSLVITFVLGGADIHISPFIPGETQNIELIILFIIILPISAIIGGVLAGYILTPLFFYIHKKIIGRNMIYGIEERPKPKEFKNTFQGLFPALMTINFALLFAFNPVFMNAVLTDDILKSNIGKSFPYIISFIVSLMFTMGISMALFSPVWFLLDAGIAYSNKKKVEGLNIPVEVRSVGGWFHYLLKGYAGIGVLFSYYILVMTFLTEIGGSPVHFIVNLIVFIPLVIFIAIAEMPAIIILDIIREHRIKFVRKWAAKLGIVDLVEITFEKIK